MRFVCMDTPISIFRTRLRRIVGCPSLPELSFQGPAAARAPQPASRHCAAPGRGVAAESLRAGSARGAAAQRHSRGAAEPTLGRTPGAPGGGVEDAEGVQKCRGTLAKKLSSFVF